MGKRRALFAMLILLLSMILGSCGSQSSSYVSTDKEAQTAASPSADATGTGNSSVTANRKEVRTVTISADTEEFTKADTAIRDAAKTAGGYIEYSSLDNYGSARSENVTVRVPAEKLDAFLTAVEGVCSVTQKSEQAEDITDAYNETESELESLETELTSLNAMLEKAQTVEDIINIQSRISDVRARISTLKAQKKTYDSEIAYSTVSIYLREAQVAVGSTETVWERISYGFRSTLHGVGTFFVDLFVFIVSASPALVIIAAIVFLTLFIVRRQKKRKAMEAQRRFEEQNKPAGQDGLGG